MSDTKKKLLIAPRSNSTELNRIRRSVLCSVIFHNFAMYTLQTKLIALVTDIDNGCFTYNLSLQMNTLHRLSIRVDFVILINLNFGNDTCLKKTHDRYLFSCS